MTEKFILDHLGTMDAEWCTFSIATFMPVLATPILEQLPELGYRLISKGPDYDLEYIYELKAVAGKAPPWSKDRFEERLLRFNARLAKLRPFPLPPYPLHQLLYRWLKDSHPSPREKPGVTTAGATNRWAGPDGNPLRLSPWISIRDLRMVEDNWNDEDAGAARLCRETVAYHLPLDSYYSLNPPAVRMLDRFRRPKTFDQVLHGNSRGSAECRRLKRTLADLLRRGLLEVVEDSDGPAMASFLF
jgi:hypothetical protein